MNFAKFTIFNSNKQLGKTKILQRSYKYNAMNSLKKVFLPKYTFMQISNLIRMFSIGYKSYRISMKIKKPFDIHC